MRSRCVEIRVECSKVDSQMLENSLPLPTRPDQISRVPFDFPSIDSPPLVEESFASTRLRGSTQIYSRRLRKIVSNQQVFDEVALFPCASQNACSSIGCNCGYMFRSIEDRRIVGNVFGFWIILLRRKSSLFLLLLLLLFFYFRQLPSEEVRTKLTSTEETEVLLSRASKLAEVEELWCGVVLLFKSSLYWNETTFRGIQIFRDCARLVIVKYTKYKRKYEKSYETMASIFFFNRYPFTVLNYLKMIAKSNLNICRKNIVSH